MGDASNSGKDSAQILTCGPRGWTGEANVGDFWPSLSRYSIIISISAILFAACSNVEDRFKSVR